MGTLTYLHPTGLPGQRSARHQWSDWNPQQGTLTIRRQLTEIAGQLDFTAPKTAKGVRTIPLPAFVQAALHEHRARMQAEGLELNDQLLVFCDTTGAPLRRSNLRRRSFAAILKAAGLPHATPHSTRHFFASAQLRAGTPLLSVSQLLGHSRPTVTLTRYGHVMPGQDAEAAARMDALLNQSGTATVAQVRKPST